MGLGTPHWDYGARGTLLGLTRGSGRPQLVRAVLEGIAHRGADLLEAAEADFGDSIGAIRVDGGMSQNPTFIQALANATGRAIEVSPHTEATTIGAAYLAGLAVGVWGSFDDIAAAWQPQVVVEPTGTTRPAAVGPGDRAGPRMDTRPVGTRLLELLRSPSARKADG